MATFRFTDLAGVGVQMGVTDVVVGSITSQTATTLRFTDDDHTITYSGEFTRRNEQFFGTMDSLKEIDGGQTILVATDLDKEAATFLSFVRNGETVVAFNYIVSGGDAIRGTDFADDLLGGGGRDLIRGRGGKDTIEGGAARDRLRGDGGADWLDGGGGKDKLYGGAGNDRLFGGRADDMLRGDAGRDVMFGGGGADRFVFADPLDFASRARPDEIRDFGRGADLIDLSALDANTLAAGEQAFRFIGDDGFSNAPGELRFENGILSGDVQGDGRPDFFIAVDDVATLSATDFLL